MKIIDYRPTRRKFMNILIENCDEPNVDNEEHAKFNVFPENHEEVRYKYNFGFDL